MTLPAFVNLSKPSAAQLKHGAERVLAVFIVGAAGFLKLSHDPLSKTTLTAAALAGATAIYQFILSTLTTL